MCVQTFMTIHQIVVEIFSLAQSGGPTARHTAWVPDRSWHLLNGNFQGQQPFVALLLEALSN